MPSLNLVSRQFGNGDDNGSGDDSSWQWYAIKWAILIAILVLFMALFVIGYAHARRRMRKNLPLKAYHRWLVPRGMRMRYEGNSLGGRTQAAWPMNTYNPGPPPPAYNPEHDYVPAYSPPPPGFSNFSKVDPDQRQNAPRVNEREVTGAAESSSQNAESYSAPSGPPPPPSNK